MISTLIGKEVGIRLPLSKRQMVEGRIRQRLRALRLPNFAAYCDYVFRSDGLAQELPYLINVVTTNKTDFFREPQHFDLLRSRLIDDVIAARCDEKTPLIKVWSAASSTGAEAYTIAMELAELRAKGRDFSFSILGTDISTDVLEQGRSAVYPVDHVRPVPQAYQSKYLMWSRRPRPGGDVRIVPEIRRLVQFHRLNLMDRRYPVDRDVDIIFLRNVLIYFDKQDQAAVINRIAGHLRPGGYLLLGHSEPMLVLDTPLAHIAPATFQRPLNKAVKS
ncbi:MAG: chemotaxis protein CheR [Devosia sp.]|nr:chemotaxis protein CheR [Devosia sp.]